MKTIFRFAFTLAIVVLAWPRATIAGTRCGHAPATSIFGADQALFNLHECVGQFPDWHWAALNIHEDEWRGRFEQPCNLTFEYAKHVNSAWLIVAQAQSPFVGDPRGRAFHPGRDYIALLKADDTAWHNNFRYNVLGGYDLWGEFDPHPIDENEIHTWCTLYDWDEPFSFIRNCDRTGTCPPPDMCPPPCIQPGVFVKPDNVDDPANRAITIVHEDWHAWEQRNLNSDYKKTLDPGSGHQLKAPPGGNIGNCFNQLECDHIYLHASNEFPVGQLKNAGRKTDYETGDPLPQHYTFHSTYQVEYEFSCDVADYAMDAIPYAVRELAALSARFDASNAIVEPIPFYCGSTRPMWTKDPSANTNIPPPCLDQNPNRPNCGGGAAGSCPKGFLNGCGADGCCVPNCNVDPTRQCNGTFGTGYFCANPAATCNPQSGCCNVGTGTPLKVDATMAFEGPRICVHGQGFETGGQVTVSYLNVPKASGPIQSFSAGADADGKFSLTDSSQEIAFGSIGDCPDTINGVPTQDAVVTVHASEPTSGLPITADGTLPARMWCKNFSQPNVVGDGCP